MFLMCDFRCAPLRRLAVTVLLTFALLGSCLPARAQDNQPPPESATGLLVKQAVTARSFMVVAAHPLASKAGADMIREGGTAADALVAVQMVLTLVEPQSSGLGGGALLLHYDRGHGELTALDGRETAPADSKPNQFLDDKGQPQAFYDAVIGGRSVGAPGTVRLMALVHQRHGKLPWAKLLQPAIDLAEQGFEVSPRLAKLIAADRERLSRDSVARDYFFNPDGSPRAAGFRLKNPALAKTLRRLAAEGADLFYTGDIARDIVSKVRSYAANPGTLSETDLKGYAIKEREPLCAPYRLYMVCGFGPPSSGGLTIAEMLGFLSHLNIAGLPPDSVDAAHALAEVGKLAFADRDLYVADTDFTAVPVSGLLDPFYIMARAQLIDRDHAAPVPVRAGNPPWREGRDQAPGEAYEFPSTSHVSIVDKAGNAISMTTTIEDGFGARLMVDGFLLNNELTDFSFRPQINGRPVANRLEPGKRPRSSMSPTIVLDEGGRPLLVVGSPGGSRIIGYLLQTLVGVLDWGLDVQAAVSLPHVLNRNGATELEADTSAVALKPALEALGHTVSIGEINSGTHAILIGNGRLVGGADPRREGVAIGE
ncbi:gamma-glutamyltranspeptidase / glutathione hydrolase [Azospirillaceae bacterium]